MAVDLQGDVLRKIIKLVQVNQFDNLYVMEHVLAHDRIVGTVTA